MSAGRDRPTRDIRRAIRGEDPKEFFDPEEFKNLDQRTKKYLLKSREKIERIFKKAKR